MIPHLVAKENPRDLDPRETFLTIEEVSLSDLFRNKNNSIMYVVFLKTKYENVFFKFTYKENSTKF